MVIKEFKGFLANKEKQIELLSISAALAGTLSIGGIFLGKPVLMTLGVSTNLVLSSAATHRAKKHYESEIDNLRSFQLDQVSSVESQANEALIGEVERLKTQAAKLIQEKEDEWELLLKDSESKVRSKAKLIDELEAEKKGLVHNLRELQIKLDQFNAERQEQIDGLRGKEIALKQLQTEAEYKMTSYAAEMATGREKLKFDQENLERERLALEKAAEELSQETAQEILGYQQRIKMLEAQIAQHQAPQLSYGDKECDSIANHIIEYFWRQETVLDFRSSFQNDSNFYVRIKPRDDSVTIKDLEKHGEAIQRLLNTSKPPTFKLHYSEIQIDLSFKPATENSPIVEPSKDWFESVLLNSKDGKLRPNHCRFVGESESGKSTLVSNAMAVIKEHCADVQFWLGDPLAESGESEWQIKPTFGSYETCFQGLVKLDEIVTNRLKNGDSNRSPIILFLDEIDDLAADYGEELIKRIKHILKQGRHANCFIWFSGQSPYCKTLKMGLSDFRNCVMFFMSATIGKGLGDINLTSERENYWLKQFELRQDAGSRFVVLVVPKRAPCFVADSPKPHQFGVVDQQWFSNTEATEDQQPHAETQSHQGIHTNHTATISLPAAKKECPTCHSIDLKKNGSYKGKQRWKCGGCGATHTEHEALVC